ncbi:MAG: hypothetical protein H6736_21825 [Alphaproteobacteria bacterium]|nr:hypothetical protein [Alphaproteobacteria bacterium]MCB9694457.1 hypothetical protein [Alphaproteobacteria bacterium]
MLALFLLVGCGTESTATFLRGNRFEWDYFNHRLSHLEYGIEDEQAHLAIVGGTSTTAFAPPLPAGCDVDTCTEFPFADRAQMRLDWGRVTTTQAVFGTGAASVVADADGETVTATIPLGARGRKVPHVLLNGYTISSNEPLAGEEACYLPQNGWLPTRVALTLGEPALSADGMSVTVDVTAVFAAGPTYEDERVCLDEVIDRARVRFDVHLLAVVTHVEPQELTFDQTQSFAYGDRFDPLEQPEPDPAEHALGVGGDADLTLGWTGWDFRFHTEGQERGAYIRSLELFLDGAGDVGWAHARNYSPGTQLSGFDYAFTGRALAFPLKGETTTGSVDELVLVDVTPDGVPTVFTYDL